MTNKEDEDELFDPEMIALLAMHIVSQVLDEAYVIAKSARDAGQSWRYFTMFKNLKGNEMGETLGDISTVSKGDSNFNENMTDAASNIIVTSTPQKLLDDKKLKTEPAYIGQGDEGLEIELDELTSTNSTSMFIQDLFDMSEVERGLVCDNTVVMQNISETKDFLVQAIDTKAISKINYSHINTAAMLTFQHDGDPANIVNETLSSGTERSEFSFLDDAYINDKAEGFRFGGEGSYDAEKYLKPTINVSVTTKLTQENFTENMDETKPIDTALNEDVYLTLNRDYDQYSDDGAADPVLQDPKELIFEEVELMTANTSDDNMPPVINPQPVQKSGDYLAATMKSASSSRKSTLIRRYRSRGARLLSCLRSWWPIKSTKPKESFCTIRDSCPLSPDARRRATSSLDQRLLRSATPSNSVTWKFNTVNEAIVSSTRWKDYTFENETDDFGK